MKLTQEQLEHIVFLCETVMVNRKRALMPDTLQMMLLIVKSFPQVEIMDGPAQQLVLLIERIEQQLMEENERLLEIRQNLSYPKNQRVYRPLD